MAAGPGCDLKIGSYPIHSRLLFAQLRQVGCASSHWTKHAQLAIKKDKLLAVGEGALVGSQNAK
jgi:hypothetical protein